MTTLLLMANSFYGLDTERLSSQSQNVQRGVMVTVKFKIATGAFENPNIEGHFLPVSARRAILGSIGGVYFNELSPSTFSLVRKIVKELSPRYIGNRFSQTMIVNHAVRPYIFNGDKSVPIDDFTTLLVGEIVTPVGNTLVNVSNNFSPLIPFGRSLRLFRHSPLGFGEGFLIRSEKSRIGDCLAIRQRGKGCNPDINSNFRIGFKEWVVRNFATKGGKPLSRRSSANSTSLNYTFDWMMNNGLNITDFRKSDRVCRDRKPSRWILRIGKTIIPVSPTKPRVSWFFARLNPSEESLERKVESYRHVLKYLRVNSRKRWSVILQGWEIFNLAIECQRLFVIFPRNLTFFEEMIVKPPTFIERFKHEFLLLASRIQSVLVSNLVHNIYCSTNLAKIEAFNNAS